jgi:hypothetical protein
LQFIGAFTPPGGEPLKGWIILDIVDKKTVRGTIQVGYAAHGFSFPTPLYPFKRVIKSDGSPSNGGTTFKKSGSNVSPGDILIRFSPISRFSTDGKRVFEDNIGISFGFRGI